MARAAACAINYARRSNKQGEVNASFDSILADTGAGGLRHTDAIGDRLF
jgi:hypothetical protein